MKFVLLGVFLVGTCNVIAQRQNTTEPSIYNTLEEDLTSLKTVAVVECENTKKEYAYFFSVDGKPVITQRAPEEVTTIALFPGVHELKLKFQAKGELPLTVDSFEALEFLKGHKYTVRWAYKPGRGEYPTSTYTARLRMWIVDDKSGETLAEKIVNGKGDLVAGN
ncbi:MAG: hypothetical protein AAGA85_15065 [Bacteroidota bacterium]